MEPIGFYNVWRGEQGNGIVRMADTVGVAANQHVYTMLNPRTAQFGVLHHSVASARTDQTGVVAPGEPFLVARLHPRHCACAGSNRIERA